MKPLATAAVASLLMFSPAMAQLNVADATAKLNDRTAAARKAAEGIADLKVWDGVVADRKAKTVTLFAVGTNIQPTDPVEFFVAPITSGKDYESLSVTTAMPSDVKAALEFIGLKPGRGVDFNADRYWPRGPRVVMNFLVAGKPVRAESLVLDTRAHRPLLPSGFIFAGSYTRDDADGKPLLAADVHEARPISPLYNEPAALLELPRQARQSEIYGTQRPSPAFTVKANEPIDVVLTPAVGTDAVGEKAALITTAVVDGATRYTLDVADAPGKQTAEPGPNDAKLDLPTLVATFAKQADGKDDVFTRVVIAPNTPVKDVRRLFAVLQAVEKDRGVKLEPPSADQLFFRAYVPDDSWKDRNTRLGEPWELFLTRGAAGKLVAKLERQIEEDGGNKKTVQTTQPADPLAMAQHIDANPSQWSRTLFVYPPADLTQGELLSWTLPSKKTLPRIFVFPVDAK